MKFGLLGQKLGHSHSPQIHALFGNDEYLLYEKSPSELESFLIYGSWDALNVTIPYKKTVVPYVDELSEEAKKLGCVNTLVRRDGKIYGYNTDVYGFRMTLERSGINFYGKKALVFGSGGASQTAQYVLREKGAKVIVISRTGENNYKNLYINQDANILVNCTPLGMYPNNGESPVDITRFPKCEAVFDMVYNPVRTTYILQAEKLNIPYYNGLLMLTAQAKRSREIFTGECIDDKRIDDIVDIISKSMQNIILIGMPGCGKTTIGKMLADRLGREFIDTDELIERKSGKSISKIFETEGEEGFRILESEALKSAGMLSGKVIATGGGCVTRAENYDALHQNGVIIWLKRDVDLLPRDGRPLSKNANLQEMYAKRKLLYSKFADFEIENNTPDETVEKIMKLVKI